VSKVQQPVIGQALYERLFACSPDAIVVVDCDGRILEVNPQVQSLFGYTASELLGTRVEILIPERLRSSHRAHRSDYGRQPFMRPMGKALDLYGRRKDGSEFPVDVMLSPVDSGEEQLILGVIRDITERKRLEEAMRQLVSTDDLTGLGNYRRLQEEFETATKWLRRSGRSSALLVLDLDGLKKINDIRGHVVGSGALCRLANAIRLECRSVDVAVRHGGDEFAVILPDTDAEGGRNLARRIASRLAKDGGDPPLSFSYGAAVYPDNGKTLHELLALADLPLYEMKKSKQ
jgi:diguanylate cyclase (GGDEF)-like protein/PAS domain S-box-containing protein